MRQIKFKEANDKSGKGYVNNTENVVIVKYKPNLWDMIKLFFGVKLWVGVNINGHEKKIRVDVRRSAFLGE